MESVFQQNYKTYTAYDWASTQPKHHIYAIKWKLEIKKRFENTYRAYKVTACQFAHKFFLMEMVKSQQIAWLVWVGC